MEPTVKYSLGKEERLKSRKQIEALFSTGKQFTVFPFRVFYAFLPLQPAIKKDIPLQSGFGVSARNFPNAVDRNRIKRLTREAYRLQKQPLFDQLSANNLRVNLFFIYTARDIQQYQQLYPKMTDCFQRLLQYVHEQTISHT